MIEMLSSRISSSRPWCFCDTVGVCNFCWHSCGEKESREEIPGYKKEDPRSKMPQHLRRMSLDIAFRKLNPRHLIVSLVLLFRTLCSSLKQRHYVPPCRRPEELKNAESIQRRLDTYANSVYTDDLLTAGSMDFGMESIRSPVCHSPSSVPLKRGLLLPL